MTGAHPRHRLDPLIHAPIRLSIVAFLSEVDQAEFGLVRESVELTAPALSKQVSMLEEAGYVKVDKGYVGKRPRTWLSLTPAGRRAMRQHLDALRAIAGDADGARGRP
jgi:DNA-binding MarR family transcriptional regulator